MQNQGPDVNITDTSGVDVQQQLVGYSDTAPIHIKNVKFVYCM